jgi:para-nitrobenzyl esterase
MTKVELSIGKLQGLESDHHVAFLGVPFARPPVGPYRFRAPSEVEPWEGTLDAAEYGYSCPQGHHPIPGMAASGPRDENCLFLNIYTPAADTKKRPVLYWIHGGGFRLGSGSELLYRGGPLAERGDVVVVAIHYRLASLGYACFGEAGKGMGMSANCGQLDQIEGLRWVSRHIERFGGDPNNVTIFGESAGSAAVGTLLAMPAAKGLFHKAIMQSGVGRASSFETGSEFGLKLLDVLGVSPGDNEAILALAADDIVDKSNEISGDFVAAGLGPVIDGETLLQSPMQANEEGFSKDIPLLIGTNRDEMKLFNAVPDRKVIDDEDLVKSVAASVQVPEEVAVEIVDVFRAVRKKNNLPSDNNDILDGVQSVGRFRNPAIRFALNHSKHQVDTYVYLFTYESPARRGAFGACHALEMPFVFGTLDAPTQDRFAGKGPEVETLSHNMMDAWINFARNANPGHRVLGEWPRFDESRRTMILNRRCQIEADPFSEERLVIEKLTS